MPGRLHGACVMGAAMFDASTWQDLPPDRLPMFVAPGEPADVAVVIVSYNTAHVITRCVDALRKASIGLSVRTLIVDNASSDSSLMLMRESMRDCIVVANAGNVGFGRANNQVLPQTDAPFVLLLNPDAYLSEDSLRLTLAYMRAHPRCGVLGADLLGEDGQRGNPMRPFPTPWSTFLLSTGVGKLWSRKVPRDVHVPYQGAHACDWVTGCFYLMRTEVLAEVGGFDPRYFLYFEEVDHCKAVWAAGWTVECLLDAKVVHAGGESAKASGPVTAARQVSELQVESELLYFRKHGGVLGLLESVAFGIAADLYVALKALVRGRDASSCRKHMVTVFRLLWRTRFGANATR